MLEAKCLKKAVVPSTLVENPSPGSFRSTRLALHVSHDPCSCFIYIASGPHIYKLQIALEESSGSKGKESLLIPEHAEALVPTSLNFVQNVVDGSQSSTIAITEGCQLTLWDLRMKENGGCLQRICGTPGDSFYAVCSSSTGNIAVGGADRTVTIYDPRRCSALCRWVHCSKFEITGLAFATIDPDYIYIQGVDYEVLCGQWKESSKLFSFRGDSNWLGFSKCSNKDVLGGWCDSGSIFIADVLVALVK